MGDRGPVVPATGPPARSVTDSSFEGPGTPSDRHGDPETDDVAPGTTLSEAPAEVTFPRDVALFVVFTDVAERGFVTDTPQALPPAALQLAAGGYPELMDLPAGRVGEHTLILAIDPASGQTAAVAGEEAAAPALPVDSPATADLLWRRGDGESTWQARLDAVRRRAPSSSARQELIDLDRDVRSLRFSVDEGLRRLAGIEAGAADGSGRG